MRLIEATHSERRTETYNKFWKKNFQGKEPTLLALGLLEGAWKYALTSTSGNSSLSTRIW